ncbi:MAG: PAS domain S-box protein [Desulfobulbaceae bacterium]|nr:MAG: PAS domain S-box protein [Desulfobulbaceae bacterium]
MGDNYFSSNKDDWPESGDFIALELERLIDLEANKKLLDSFCDSVGVAAALIDLQGTVLLGSRWQPICTDYHRVNADTCKKCIESDTILANSLSGGERYCLYKCRNGLTDAAAPLILEDQHIANVFVGQFLTAQPDVDFFRTQATRYGFDETAYLEALARVPIIDEDKIPSITSFLVNFAEMQANILLDHKRQIESERRLNKARQHIENLQEFESELLAAHEKVALEKDFSDMVINSLPGIFYLIDQKGRFQRWNKNFETVTGYSTTEMRELHPLDLFSGPEKELAQHRINQVFSQGNSNLEALLHTKEGARIPYFFTGLKFSVGSEPFLLGTGVDLSSQKEATRLIEEDRKRVLSLLDGIEDVIYVADPETYELLHANKVALDAWGDDLIGKKCYTALQSRDEPCPFCTNEKIFGEYRGKAYVWEFQNEVNKRWYRCSDKAIEWVDGRLVRFEIASDITQRKLLETQLTENNKALERSNQELEQFAYVASHDLQEPLRMVASYLQLLADRYRGQLDEKADRYINYAYDGAERMHSLINDLLLYSRVSTQGKAFSTFSLDHALRSALQNLQILIKEHGAEITSDSLPQVVGDTNQFTQLLQNLIGNAIKFRTESGPRIQIRSKDQGDDVLVSVSDNGIGIEPRHKERIFDIFKRLHTREHYSGNGIGLAVCKRIIERHGGTIWCESEEGHGTTFFFTIKKAAGT